MVLPLGAPLPDFAGATGWLNGVATRQSLAGKPVLVHFFAASCVLCKEGLSVLPFLHDLHGPAVGLQLVGVHRPQTRQDAETASVEAVLREHDLGHPVLLDNRLAVSEAFGNDGLPAYYLFDKTHRLRHAQAGEHALRFVEQRLKAITSRT